MIPSVTSVMTMGLRIFAMPAFGQERPTERRQDDAKEQKRVTEEVERLIQQLGSRKFAEREAAGRRLDAIGEPALRALRRAETASDDVEIRRQASRIAQ